MSVTTTKTTLCLLSILFFTCSTEQKHEVHTPADGHKGIMLTDNQMILGNITSAVVAKRSVGQTLVINGQLKIDEQKSKVISSRAAGRVEKLFIKEAGRNIRQGEPLYVLYSETLLTLQQEYLLAREQYALLGDMRESYKSILEGAERKLFLYGLSRSQVDKLSASTLQPRVTFVATASGIVTDINVDEGQYVDEGTALYNLEDINTLWVEAELYPNETSLVEVGDNISVRVSGVEGNPIETKVSFLSPEFRKNSQIAIMRAPVENPEGVFKPGQFVQVHLTHSTKEAIAVPPDAVIRDSQGAHVYLQSDHNTFRPQRVTTGLESFDQIEITGGLKEGDTLAITGAYLLYGETVFRKGGDPMAGHHR